MPLGLAADLARAPVPQSNSLRHGSALLANLAADIRPALTASRSVLLGSRDLAGPSCADQELRGGRLILTADPAGGPGLRVLALYRDQPDPPNQLYAWTQGPLRAGLERMRGENAAVLPRVRCLSNWARDLALMLHGQQGLPRDLVATADGGNGNWPEYCLDRLNRAVAERNLQACRRWADELAAATFAVADLHGWLELLLENHLASVDFQRRCQALFTWSDQLSRDGWTVSEAYLSASFMMVTRANSYLEVERQAETLFQVPKAYAAEALKGMPAVRSAARMPPDLRESFLTIRSRLSPSMQGLWDAAAATPFERTYMTSVLYRVSQKRLADEVSVVLRRFERSHPKPTVPAMMDTLFHRAGFYSSGFRWDDRYDARLMGPAGQMDFSVTRALQQAHALTSRFFGGRTNYRSGIMTLEDALNTRKLDCVRGTDMIGALFRNAGQSDYCLVRLCGGVGGHSVGGAAVERGGQQQVALVDSLSAKSDEELWPSAYFRGLVWPDQYPGPRWPVFSAELCVRGLDGYLFAEGYVIRGPHAGELVRASLPHLPGRKKATVAKVYAGPYPDLPGRPPVPTRL